MGSGICTCYRQSNIENIFLLSQREVIFQASRRGNSLFERYDRRRGVYQTTKDLWDDLVKVQRLLRALYGHPKAGQLWNDQFVNFMKNEGFI